MALIDSYVGTVTNFRHQGKTRRLLHDTSREISTLGIRAYDDLTQ
jgi:hypothetical protein